MKLMAILLFLFCMQVSARSGAQTVTISVKNAPLKEVFRQIQKQTGMNIMVKQSLLDKAGKVSLTVTNMPVPEALKLCFANTPLDFEIDGNTITVIPKKTVIASGSEATSQTLVSPPPIDIHGRILNEKGEPVIASVQVKGTNKGTTTNDNGEFELKGVDDNATLVISGVSIETFEVKVSGRSELALGAKIKSTVGEEVTIEANTGYQRVKPNEVTGSLVVIYNKKLNEQTSPNILKRLEGVTPGLLFDNNKQRTGSGIPINDAISIRGLSTINAPMDPLIILDGFIYEGSISNINPNDVESVTVLKDAAATSIWGARAGNGVIVITTKKGQFNQKIQVGINSDVIVGQKSNLHYLPQMSSSDYIDVEQTLFNNGFFDGNIFLMYSALSPSVNIFNEKRNGLISSADSASLINALKSIDTRDQYLKYIYVKPVTQQYSVNIRGGSNTNAYTLSIAYDKLRGELHNRSDKANIKVEDVFKPTKNLLVDLSVYYTNSKDVSGAGGYPGLLIGGRPIPYFQIADANGRPLPVDLAYNGTYTDSLASGKLLDWKYYPLEDWKHNRSTTNLEELYSNLNLQYKLARFLNIDLKYQYQKQQSQLEHLSDLSSYYTRDIINSFSQIDPASGAISSIIPLGGIRNVGFSNTESQTARAQLNFNNTWHNSNIMVFVGGETRQLKLDANSFTEYGYNADPLTFTPVDFQNQYPTLITGNSQGIPGSPMSSKYVYHYASIYGNASYTFKRKYIVSASARRDGANIFGANTNDKWKPLWSIGTAWNLSDESFYKFSLLPSLKFRITYGYNGNVDPSRSALPVGTYIGPAPFTNFPIVRVQVLNNPDLRWEKTGMLNIGADFSTRKNIISGSIEYYQKKGTDLYGPSLYDYTTWGVNNVVTINSADLKGKGVDVILNSKNIDRRFKWYSTLLINYNTNKVTKYYGQDANSITSKFGADSYLVPVLGKPLYAIAAYKWGGLDSAGNPQGFVNGKKSSDYSAIFDEGSQKGVDGNIDYLGPSSPPYFGSLNNTFSWGSFALSTLITYKFGYYFRKSTLSYSLLVNSGIGDKEFANRWQKPGDETKTNVPSFVFPVDNYRDNFYNLSSVNVLKADHIRLQYVNLSYTISNDRFKKMPFREVQFYINAANLGIIWRSNKLDIDPEYPTSVPPSKTWTFGLRANFR